MKWREISSIRCKIFFVGVGKEEIFIFLDVGVKERIHPKRMDG